MYLIPVVISLLGILSAICWGLADFLAAKASKKYSPDATELWGTLIGSVLFSVIFIFSRGHLAWSSLGIIYAAIGGILFSVGYMTFYRGLKIGPVSIVSPVGSAYPLVTLLFVLLIFRTSLTFGEVIGVLVTVVGIVLASEISGSIRKKKAISSGFKLALMTFLLWGIAFALFGRSVSLMGWQKATLIDFWASWIFIFIWLIVTLGKKFRRHIKLPIVTNPLVFGNGLLLLIGWVVFAYGLSRSSTSAVITAIAATYPALTIFLSLKYLGEKKKLVPLIGAVVTLAGVIILSI